VVKAADAVAFYPAGRELRAAVGAAEGNHVRCAALASVEREVLAQDADGLGVAGRQVLGAVDGLPEAAQVLAGERAGPGVDEVGVVRPSGTVSVRGGHAAPSERGACQLVREWTLPSLMVAI
jgi:hypothetical protein